MSQVIITERKLYDGINENDARQSLKFIPPFDAGGVAGGAKYLVNKLFFKVNKNPKCDISSFQKPSLVFTQKFMLQTKLQR